MFLSKQWSLQGTQGGSVFADGKTWRPTKDEWEQLCVQVFALNNGGLTIAAMARVLDLPLVTVRRALIRARQEIFTAADRQHVRRWAILRAQHPHRTGPCPDPMLPLLQGPCAHPEVDTTRELSSPGRAPTLSLSHHLDTTRSRRRP